MQAGSVIECNWECTGERAWECSSKLLESWCGSIQSSRLGVCHRVQVRASLGACPRVYSRIYLECTWEHLVSLLEGV